MNDDSQVLQVLNVIGSGNQVKELDCREGVRDSTPRFLHFCHFLFHQHVCVFRFPSCLRSQLVLFLLILRERV